MITFGNVLFHIHTALSMSDRSQTYSQYVHSPEIPYTLHPKRIYEVANRKIRVKVPYTNIDKYIRVLKMITDALLTNTLLEKEDLATYPLNLPLAYLYLDDSAQHCDPVPYTDEFIRLAIELDLLHYYYDLLPYEELGQNRSTTLRWSRGILQNALSLVEVFVKP